MRSFDICRKGIVLAVLAVWMCLSGPGVHRVQSAEVVDRIVAVVNEDIIRLSDLNRHLDPIKEQIRSRRLSSAEEAEMIFDAREQLIEDLIDETLVDQVIQEAGIRVTPGEIDATIEQIKSANQLTQEDLRRALQARGIRMETYREDIRQQILRSKVIDQKVKSKIVVTEEDIRETYGSEPEKYGITEKYRLRNIFMLYGEDRDQVRREMETVLEELEAGASFDEMARKHSMAPNAEEGGELGAFVLGDLSEHLQPVIAALEPGRFTDIVETEMGFQIFFLEDIEEPEQRELEDVEKRIEQTLYEQKVEEKFDNWLKSLRESAHIRVIL
ncbi:MAG: SurA N-terminal domain-containing protein [Desulfosalsimonadaceae bacterium]